MVNAAREPGDCSSEQLHQKLEADQRGLTPAALSVICGIVLGLRLRARFADARSLRGGTRVVGRVTVALGAGNECASFEEGLAALLEVVDETSAPLA